MTVSQWMQRKRKGPLADPVLGGRPAEVTSANAYTLNLWAAGEDHTLTKRESECKIRRETEEDVRKRSGAERQ